MIDAVGVSAAILAAMIIASENRPSRHCSSPVIRHLNYIPQSDNQWSRHNECLSPDLRAVFFDNFGFV
jgi:hypothetical protein